ncbi:hypothetical protein PPL_09954 [Heterostelium album PN500]|uniref:Methyltransferase type 11 domain-containing protein n=1 Tax=Heterostelium pallidum (strain ATCC 26659 / Pp 5 / PN500) TaxID=670386 RepID=D3BPM9_HETP5|nr:hypothetical protein PPL_09954 [Heterostelium album PN500]EFA76649.1 hypothetical protein PPL_09954 [Heterostelium album PN500]|eukprot:XP_020428781.1 hypothetical protein PPL_09954 [Heterostelium album PN500]
MSLACQYYGEREYWDQRYEDDKKKRPHFDWYHGYKTLKPFLSKYFLKLDRILMLGCGNSKLGEDMNDDEYKEIVNIDFSDVLIQDMKNRTVGREGLEYLTMDGRDMDFESDSFDSIFDKGTIDAVMCSDDDNSNAKRMITEVSRVLKPGGFFVVMTYGSPENRLPVLNVANYNWTVYMRMLGTSPDAQSNQCHYIYIMRKNIANSDNSTADQASLQQLKSIATNPFDPSTEHFETYLYSSVGKIALEVTPVVK